MISSSKIFLSCYRVLAGKLSLQPVDATVVAAAAAAVSESAIARENTVVVVAATADVCDLQEV